MEDACWFSHFDIPQNQTSNIMTEAQDRVHRQSESQTVLEESHIKSKPSSYPLKGKRKAVDMEDGEKGSEAKGKPTGFGITKDGPIRLKTSSISTTSPSASVSASASALTSKSASVLKRQPVPQQSFQINMSQKPIVPVDIGAKVPREKRQKLLDLFYKEFVRLYRPLLKQAPALAHEHALKQEQSLHSKASKLTYSVLGMGMNNNTRLGF
jgi:hypothetical protein